MNEVSVPNLFLCGFFLFPFCSFFEDNNIAIRCRSEAGKFSHSRFKTFAHLGFVQARVLETRLVYKTLEMESQLPESEIRRLS